MKFLNLQRIHFNFVWFLRKKKLKIDFKYIFYFFKCLISAIISNSFNRTCAKFDKFSQNAWIIFSGHNTTKQCQKPIQLFRVLKGRNFWSDLQKIYSLKLYFILPMKWYSNIQTISYPYIFFFSSSYWASLISCIVMVPMDSTELQK